MFGLLYVELLFLLLISCLKFAKNSTFAVLNRVVLVFRFYFFLFAFFLLLPEIGNASESSFTADSMAVVWEKFDLKSEESKNTIALNVLHDNDSLFIETIEKKINQAQNKNNTADLLKSYLALGSYYSLDFKYPLALASFEKAKLYASTIEQNAQILLAIARVKIDASLFVEALEYLRQAKTVIYKKDYFDLLAEILIEEGYCYTQINNFAVAETRYSTALSMPELENLTSLQAKLLCYQGFNYLQQNNYINAMACLVRSIDMNKMDSLNSTHALALKLVGKIYAQQENSAKSLNYFLLSQSISRKLNNQNEIADIELETGLLYLKDTTYLKSLPHLNNALKIYERIGNQVGICKANNALADYYIKSKQLNLVPNHLWEANSADQFLNDHRLYFLTTFHFAKYYLACSKYDSALYYANKTFDYNKGNSDIDLLISTHEILSDIYSATGDYKKSMAALKTVQRMKESQSYKIHSYELKLIQVELESIRQQTVINSLTQERNNQSIALENNVKRIEKQNYIIYFVVVALFFIVILLPFLFYYMRQKRKFYLKLEIRNKQIAQQKEEIEVQQQFLIDINQELEKLSIVARETDNGIKVMNSMGHVTWINEGYAKMHGYSLEEIQQTQSMDLFGEHANVDINKMVNVWFGDKKPISYESLNKTKWGADIWVQTSLTPILDESGKLTQMIAIDSDITRIKLAENEILTKNLDITSSISYAKRIQEAMMTPFSILTSRFPDSFCYHVPKSIVSGDFYWISKQHNRLIVVCADSTGHGVPGAFMSLIGISFLNKIVNEKGFVSPSIILNRLRMNIISQLHQNNGEHVAGDGMDMSIISIDLKNNQLEFAGAMNPILILRNDDMIELKPDRMPVGFFDNEDRPFSLTNLNLQPKDQIFMFTDGYYDQFGGKNGSKMKGQKFKEIIKACANKSIVTQQQIIEDQFNCWKGDHPQVDDILVLGITVN